MFPSKTNMINKYPEWYKGKTMTDLNNAIDTLKVDADKLTADINAAEAAQNAQADAATPAVVTDTAAV